MTPEEKQSLRTRAEYNARYGIDGAEEYGQDALDLLAEIAALEERNREDQSLFAKIRQLCGGDQFDDVIDLVAELKESERQSAFERDAAYKQLPVLEERNRVLEQEIALARIGLAKHLQPKLEARVTELESTVQALTQQVEAKADYGYRMDALAEERLIEITALKKAVQLHLNTIEALQLQVEAANLGWI